jgi:hypothetical protein
MRWCVAILNLIDLSLRQIGHPIGINQETQKLGDRETNKLMAEFHCLSSKSFSKDGPKMPEITDAQFLVS